MPLTVINGRSGPSLSGSNSISAMMKAGTFTPWAAGQSLFYLAYLARCADVNTWPMMACPRQRALKCT